MPPLPPADPPAAPPGPPPPGSQGSYSKQPPQIQVWTTRSPHVQRHSTSVFPSQSRVPSLPVAPVLDASPTSPLELTAAPPEPADVELTDEPSSLTTSSLHAGTNVKSAAAKTTRLNPRPSSRIDPPPVGGPSTVRAASFAQEIGGRIAAGSRSRPSAAQRGTESTAAGCSPSCAPARRRGRPPAASRAAAWRPAHVWPCAAPAWSGPGRRAR